VAVAVAVAVTVAVTVVSLAWPLDLADAPRRNLRQWHWQSNAGPNQQKSRSSSPPAACFASPQTPSNAPHSPWSTPPSVEVMEKKRWPRIQNFRGLLRFLSYLKITADDPDDPAALCAPRCLFHDERRS